MSEGERETWEGGIKRSSKQFFVETIGERLE